MRTTSTTPDKAERLLVRFPRESMTTVTRSTVREIAAELGFDETQTINLAMARLRDHVRGLGTADIFESLTDEHHKRIGQASGLRGTKATSTLLDALPD